MQAFELCTDPTDDFDAAEWVTINFLREEEAWSSFSRSIASLRPSTSSLMSVSNQIPSFLVARRTIRPEALLPVAEKSSTAPPDCPLTLIEPIGKPVAIGGPSRPLKKGSPV